MSGERLFRMPVEISGKLDWEPPAGGPDFFGMPDSATRAEIGLVISGPTREAIRSQCTLSVNFSAMSDEAGNVLSVGMWLRDKDGETVENISLMIAQADAERLGQAIAAIFSLTPKPGDTKP